MVRLRIRTYGVLKWRVTAHAAPSLLPPFLPAVCALQNGIGTAFCCPVVCINRLLANARVPVHTCTRILYLVRSLLLVTTFHTHSGGNIAKIVNTFILY